MSDTPETDRIVRNAAMADHPPTRLAATLTVKCEKLERERDEAIRKQDETNRSSKYACDFHYEEKLKAERERDEARRSLENITEYGTEEINAAVELRQKLAQALVERDEARADLEFRRELYKVQENYLELERRGRGEAREIIRMAKAKFCEEGSDGNIASEMFSILSGAK
jgi:hypothetical protein